MPAPLSGTNLWWWPVWMIETDDRLKKFHMLLRGGAGRKTFLLIFQPTHFIVHLLWSVWKNIGKNQINFFTRFVSMEMVAIFDFRALTKVHNYNFKIASSNAVKNCTHIEDIQMKKRTEACLFLLHNTFLIMFCVKNPTKIRQNFRFCWIKNKSECLKKCPSVRF